ncbi:MAG: DUF1549 domain-containing protein [Planctomycetota bacterium]
MRLKLKCLAWALIGALAVLCIPLRVPPRPDTAAAAPAKDTGKNTKGGGKGSAKAKSKAKGTTPSQSPASKAGVAASANRQPALKTADDKLALLERIHRSFPARYITSGFTVDELDRQLKFLLALPPDRLAPPVDDEQFARRVHLDLTGRLPTPEATAAFLADTDSAKRGKLVDRLLETDEFSRHWAKYWRDVVFHDSTANRRRVDPQALENWFAQQFSKKVGWDRIVCELISATPKQKKGDRNEFGQDYGPNNFVLACNNDPGEIASQTARIFMGISIQCAECHDHPFDQWKREQFHEMAAFFAPGKYMMPDMDEPAKKTEVKARFLLGEKPSPELKPDALRVAVAAYLAYNPDNYWFARAFVNRIWSEMLGDGFYPVDGLGPDKECIHPQLLNRLGTVFRYQDFNIRWVFRTIASSQAYQRSSRSVDVKKELFAAVRPARLRSDQVVNVVEHVAGDVAPKLEKTIAETFATNPSASQESLEGSLQQSLLLMNSPALHAALRKSRLRVEASQISDPDEAIDHLYRGALARKPTADERSRARRFIVSVPDRAEAIDDLLWTLVNSTEFMTRR